MRFNLHPITKLPLLLLLSTVIPSVAAANTQFSSNGCAIEGDPDVYAFGIRLSFYLQWAASVILLFFSPNDADIARKASVAIILALYINEFQSIIKGNLIALEWQVLWLMTFSLNMFNWPVSRKGYKKNGATISLMLVLWAAYYIASPWVFFRGLDNGAKDGCDLKMFIFTPLSMYSRGFRTAFKVLSIMNAAIVPPLTLIGAVFALGKWFETWHDKEVREYEEEPNAISVILGVFQLAVGAFAIGILEKTLKLNHVSFPDSSITNSKPNHSLGFRLKRADAKICRRAADSIVDWGFCGCFGCICCYQNLDSLNAERFSSSSSPSSDGNKYDNRSLDGIISPAKAPSDH